MFRSESIISNLLLEVDSINNRIKNIKLAYSNTEHDGLRERLLNENKIIYQRLNQIYLIAKTLSNRTIEKINFSNLLVEICERIIAKTRREKNLFFL